MFVFRPLRLQWINCLLTVSSDWSVSPALTELEVQSCAYYLMELEQKYGGEACDELRSAMASAASADKKEEGEGVPRDAVKELLQNLYRNKWRLDKKTLVV